MPSGLAKESTSFAELVRKFFHGCCAFELKLHNMVCLFKFQTRFVRFWMDLKDKQLILHISFLQVQKLAGTMPPKQEQTWYFDSLLPVEPGDSLLDCCRQWSEKENEAKLRFVSSQLKKKMTQIGYCHRREACSMKFRFSLVSNKEECSSAKQLLLLFGT